MKNYYCDCCNYPTNKLSNLKKHMSTQKHKNNLLIYNNKINIIFGSSANVAEGSVINAELKIPKYHCIYCDKNIRRSDKARHLRTCQKKKEYEITQEKNKLQKELNDEKEKTCKLMKEIDKIKKEHLGFLKNIIINSNNLQNNI